MKKEDNQKQKTKTQQQQNKSDGGKNTQKKKHLELQINFLIIIYTVLQIYNVYGEGYVRHSRRGNLHHYSVRDYNQSS